MAEGGKSDIHHSNDNVPGWTNGKDSNSLHYRSDLLREIIEQRSQSQLMAVLECGWDVNERLIEPKKYTALQKAAEVGWIEGVKILFDAGASCKAIDGQNPLALGLHYNDYPIDLIRLLIIHGADPNDHDCKYDNIPLFHAIRNCRQGTSIVKLLLELGADPNVTSQDQMYQEGNWTRQWTVLHEAVRSGCMELVKMFLGADFVTPDIIAGALAVAFRNVYWDTAELSQLAEMLLERGADADYITLRGQPLLHLMCQYRPHEKTIFFSKCLDLFFQNGCDINVEDDIKQCHTHMIDHRYCAHGTVVQSIVKRDATRGGIVKENSNIVRWLIRHGADLAPLRFKWLEGYFIPCGRSFLMPSQIPLILLEAGMRVPNGAQTRLRNMEVAIHSWLQEDTEEDGDIIKTLHDMWVKVVEVEEEELQRMSSSFKKSTFPEYRTIQMVDLQEFSDESLNVYQEDKCTLEEITRTDEYQCTLTQIREVLKFLSELHSLQWYCRQCIRESLVSLQPSVVKTLPLPPKLKQYLLCHEI